MRLILCPLCAGEGCKTCDNTGKVIHDEQHGLEPKKLPWWLRLFKKPKPQALQVWQRLDTKYQWEPGERHLVEVWDEQDGKTVIGYVYAIDLYSIMLYDEQGFLIGKYPKEAMVKLLD